MENKKSELDSRIKNLCVLIHTELESIEGPQKSSKNIEEILQFTTIQALNYISSIIDQGIETKSKAKQIPLYSEFINNESYQKEMQKLESEIRNHIKIEQQMKIFADALEEKTNSLETLKLEMKESSKQKIALLVSENKNLRHKISVVSAEIEKRKKNESKDVSKAKIKENKSTEVNKKIAKVDNDHSKISKSLIDIDKEYDQQKKDNKDLKLLIKQYLKSGSEENLEIKMLYKQKYDKKCFELDSIKQKVKYMEILTDNKRHRSVTPNLVKSRQMSKCKSMKKIPSVEKIKSSRFERTLQRAEQIVEKKRLPLAFTSRK